MDLISRVLQRLLEICSVKICEPFQQPQEEEEDEEEEDVPEEKMREEKEEKMREEKEEKMREDALVGMLSKVFCILQMYLHRTSIQIHAF